MQDKPMSAPFDMYLIDNKFEHVYCVVWDNPTGELYSVYEVHSVEQAKKGSLFPQQDQSYYHIFYTDRKKFIEVNFETLKRIYSQSPCAMKLSYNLSNMRAEF